MPLWRTLTSYLTGNTSKPTTTSQNDKMNTLEFSPKETVRLERSPSIPIAPSKKQAPTSLPYRPVDPSQTLQLPFHESQKAETPFTNPLGESMIIITPPSARTTPHANLPSSERTPQNLAGAAAKPRQVFEDGEEKGTWQDGWVKIVDLENETEKEKAGSLKKRCKKEWRNEEAEPAKKKSKDHNTSSWAKKQKMEGLGASWRPEVSGIRRRCT